jgi:hypothetical protein
MQHTGMVGSESGIVPNEGEKLLLGDLNYALHGLFYLFIYFSNFDNRSLDYDERYRTG